MDAMLRRSGVRFSVMRNEVEVLSAIGLDNRETATGKRYVGFMPETDVQAGDILISPANEQFYVTDTKIAFFTGKPHRLMAYYQTSAERNGILVQQSTPIFNIENAYGSVIGTGNSATINYNASIQSLMEQVKQSDSPDKEDMEKIVSLLEMIINNQVPPSKGLFSKFSGIMERHSWLSNSVAATILGWLMSQIS